MAQQADRAIVKREASSDYLCNGGITEGTWAGLVLLGDDSAKLPVCGCHGIL